jgi:dethiobiotin synthetase
VSDELEIVNPYRFEKPLAPWVAAEQERKEINLERLRESFERLKQRHEFLIVEGVGGLLVPLTAHHLISDVAQLFQLPLVVVAKAGLGTINHTLLTIRQAQILELAILGVIINNPTGETGPAEETNPQVLPRLITVPLLGVVPYCSELKGNNTLLKRLIEENVDLRGITRNFAANYSCGGIPR